MSEERLETPIVAKPGVSKWGLRGRVREGVYCVLLGARGLCPRKNFQVTDARRRVLVHFQTKINTFMPVNFVKVSNPFDFQRLATEDARKNRHEAPKKLQNSSLPIALVDDLLLVSLDLVRLSRFQVG
jgi:hypothetical protein